MVITKNGRGRPSRTSIYLAVDDGMAELARIGGALALRRAAEKGRLKAVRKSNGWYSTKQWVATYARSRRMRRRTPETG